MIKHKITDIMIKNKVITSNDAAIYNYGLQVLFEKLLSIAISLLISVIFNNLLFGVLLTISFAMLRQYAGGYHANHFLSCLCITCVIMIIFNLLIDLPVTLVFTIVSLAVSFPVIVFLAPVDSKSKPLDSKEKQKYKRHTVIIYVVELVILAILLAFSLYKFAFCISYTMFAVALLLVAGLIKNRLNINTDNQESKIP